MTQFVIRDIELEDLPYLKRFKCGNQSMDYFLSAEAYKCHVFGEGITKVVLSPENEIIAYYTIKTDSMKIEDEDMYDEPRYIPCVEISRIAVLRSWQQGKNIFHLGTYLMGHIITFIKEEIATRVGCRFITLHSVLDKVNWYVDNFGFTLYDDSIPENSETVYMYLDINNEEKIQEYLEYVRSQR